MTSQSDHADPSDSLTPAVAPKQAFRPVLGVIALVASAIAPSWLVIALIAGGLETAAWIPMLMLLTPLNLLFFALFLTAVLCGIFAGRRTGINRRLGQVALGIATFQLIASFGYLLWSVTDLMNYP